MNKELIKDSIDDRFYTAKNDNVFKAIFCDENNTFLYTRNLLCKRKSLQKVIDII